jgi:hypothetical protein
MGKPGVRRKRARFGTAAVRERAIRGSAKPVRYGASAETAFQRSAAAAAVGRSLRIG